MASLYALTADALRFQSRIDAAAEQLFSDDPQEVATATADLEALIASEADNRKALEAKADAWCWVIDHLRAQAVTQREHSRRLAELASEAEHRAEVLQDRLTSALERIDPDRTAWALPEHKLNSRKVTSVELDPDVAPVDLPEGLCRVKTTYSADKSAIKAALQAGTAVPGCQLVERSSWTIK
ncbi:MAG: siphovirus Gp157 family protein [Synechococcaceae cyanobacterium]|nr:siphovirus Gp157 family protein [Synechococcaceae cyanobacterium]